MISERRNPFVCLCAVVIVLVVFLTGCTGSYKELSTSVVPKPNKLTVTEGRFTFDKDAIIYVQSDDAASGKVAGYLASLLNAAPDYRVTVMNNQTAPAGKNTILVTTVDVPPTLGNEGYLLTVGKDLIVLKANTPAGLFYGFQTIRQLLPVELEKQGLYSGGKLAIQCVEIEDIPRFVWRGMHLDVSRHFSDVETVKKFIDNLAIHKMNVFHWHLTDSQGWRIEIRKYPKLTEVAAWRAEKALRSEVGKTAGDGSHYGGFYTQDEIRDVIKYAADRFITVLPEIEMPGHSSAALVAYPEYLCDSSGKATGSRNPDVYCAGKEETYMFLQDVLDEVIELFPSSYIHIGADEVSKRAWQQCKYCQSKIKREGLKDEEELQSYFVRRMEKHLISRGRKLIGWDEILQGGLAPEATVMSWRGMEGGIEAARQGHNVIMAPEDWVYFNHFQSERSLEPVSWGGFTPLREVYSLNPTPEELTPEEAKYVIGAQGCLWAEYLVAPDLVEYMLLPRLDALSEVVWTDQSNRDWEDFKVRMIRQYERYDIRGANYARSPYNIEFDITIDPTTGNAQFTMSNDAAGNDIRYTLDGSEPGPRSSQYKGPVTIDKTAIVKAGSFVKGKQVGKTVSSDFTRHKAVGKPVVLTNQQPGRDDRAMILTNGHRGSHDSTDGQWLVLRSVDLVATVDLGKSMPVESISTNFLNQSGRTAFAPSAVEYAISEDGINFTTVAIVGNITPITGADPVIVPFRESFKNVQCRYVRIQASRNQEVARSLLYLDEIIVE